MAIPVTCPGCHTRFQVSDQYAGKTGPCPKCKGTIRVPTKEEEVKVYEPTQFGAGGRGVSGQLLTKPIARKDTKLDPVVAIAIAGSVVVVLLATWAGRGLIQANLIVRSIGLLLVSPPLAVAGYTFLRNDDELQPHRGLWLYVRAASCAAGYALLWGVYAYVANVAMSGEFELWNWVIIAPPFLLTGALIALATLDLDFGSGFFHYSFYVLVTMLLRWTAGMGWL